LVVEFEMSVDLEEGTMVVGDRHSTAVIPHSSLLSLISHHPTGTTVAQTTNGTVLRYSTAEGLLPWKLPTGTDFKFPDGPCDAIAMTTFKGKERIVGLNVFRRSLYVDDCKVATGATTFDLHNEFLIYTTDSHKCRFIPLTSDPTAQPVWNGDMPGPLDEGMRRVERGSRVVAVVPHDFKLVLQMPRGNLETIFPRPLVLSSVRRHLDRCCYGDAFITMRKHRINLNLIYDHNPTVI
jgi:elongator complex protein 1